MPQGSRPDGLLLKLRRSASKLKALRPDLHGSRLNGLGLLLEAQPSAPLAGVTGDMCFRGSWLSGLGLLLEPPGVPGYMRLLGSWLGGPSSCSRSLRSCYAAGAKAGPSGMTASCTTRGRSAIAPPLLPRLGRLA